MNNSIQELRSCLYQLLKMDYGVELYNYTDIDDNVVLPGFVRISFYHLSSVHNAMCTHNAGATSEPCIDWQYARENKKAAALVKRATVAACKIICLKHLQLVIDEFEYYHEKASAVFDAKYATDVWLHTCN